MQRKRNYLCTKVEENHLPQYLITTSRKKCIILSIWVRTSSKIYFLARKRKPVDPCNKLRLVWESGFPENIKVSFFRACVESILLYRCKRWNINKKLEQRLDGTCAFVLIGVRDLNWKQHLTVLQRICKGLPSISSVIKSCRLRFAGHCNSKGSRHLETCSVAITNITPQSSSPSVVHQHYEKHGNNFGGTNKLDVRPELIKVNGEIDICRRRRMMVLLSFSNINRVV